VLINGLPATRVLDVVVESPGLALGPMNPIASGCATVLIGDLMGGSGAKVPSTVDTSSSPASSERVATPSAPTPTLASPVGRVSEAPGPAALRAAKRLKAPFVRKCGT
jgi:hypothetical protein